MSNIEKQPWPVSETAESKVTASSLETERQPATQEQLSDQLSKTKEEIGETEESKKATEEQLREVRAQMGLHEPGKPDHSVEQSGGRLDTLEDRKKSLREGLEISPNESSAETAQTERERELELGKQVAKVFQDLEFIRNAQDVQRAFQNAAGDSRLEPLANPEATVSLGRAVNDFETVLNETGVDVERLNSSLENLTHSLEDMQEISKNIAFSMELVALANNSLGRLNELNNDIQIKIKKVDESTNHKASAPVRLGLGRFNEQVAKKQTQMYKLYNFLEEYNNIRPPQF